MKYLYLLFLIIFGCSSFTENERDNPFDSSSNSTSLLKIVHTGDQLYTGIQYKFEVKIYTIIENDTSIYDNNAIKNTKWNGEEKNGTTNTIHFGTSGNKSITVDVTYKDGNTKKLTYNFIVKKREINDSFTVSQFGTQFGNRIDFDLSVNDKKTNEALSPETIEWATDLNGVFSDKKSFSYSNLKSGVHNLMLKYRLKFEDFDRTFSSSFHIDPIPNISGTIQSPVTLSNFNIEEQIQFQGKITKGADNEVKEIRWIYDSSIIATSLSPTLNSSHFKKGDNKIIFEFEIEDGFIHKDSIIITVHFPGVTGKHTSKISSDIKASQKNGHVIITSSSGTYYVNFNSKSFFDIPNNFTPKTIVNSLNDIITYTNSSIYSYDQLGQEQNSHNYSSNYVIKDITIDNEDNIYFVFDQLAYPYNSYLRKLDPNLTPVWTRLMRQNGFSKNIFYKNDHLYTAHYDKRNYRGLTLLKISKDNDLILSRSIPGGNYNLAETDESLFITYSNNSTLVTTFAKIDDQDSLITYKTNSFFFTMQFDVIESPNKVIYQYNNNGYNVLSGIQTLERELSLQHIKYYDNAFYAVNGNKIYKYDNNFQLIYEKTFKGSGAYFFNVDEYQGNILIVGVNQGDSWVFKIDPNTGDFIY